jgi:DNA-binding response OmpR family regulator
MSVILSVNRAAPGVALLTVPNYGVAHEFLHRLDRHDGPEPIRIGDVQVEPETRRVLARGMVVHLSEHEFSLLLALCCDMQRAWAFGELYEAVWHSPYLGDATAVRSAVKRLTRKLLDAGVRPPIESVRGFGFRAIGHGSS